MARSKGTGKTRAARLPRLDRVKAPPMLHLLEKRRTRLAEEIREFDRLAAAAEEALVPNFSAATTARNRWTTLRAELQRVETEIRLQQAGADEVESIEAYKATAYAEGSMGAMSALSDQLRSARREKAEAERAAAEEQRRAGLAAADQVDRIVAMLRELPAAARQRVLAALAETAQGAAGVH